MAITYLYAEAVNKPAKVVNIDNLSKVANVSTATDYNKYSFTDTDVIYFYSLSGAAPAVSDKIVIMQDSKNYLMPAAAYSYTYTAVA